MESTEEKQKSKMRNNGFNNFNKETLIANVSFFKNEPKPVLTPEQRLYPGLSEEQERTLQEWEKNDPKLAEDLRKRATEKLHESSGTETNQKDTYIEGPPELKEESKLPEDLGKDACTWLDDYVEYSRKWSPKGYDGFHEVCGIWLLSTVAARRIGTNFGKVRHTGLYFALIARSSLFAKTTTADIAIDLLYKARLDFLLAPDSSTPQKFISDMGEKLPGNYAALDSEFKERAKLRLALAGKRGWYYDEFSQQLAGMMRENGMMADFRGILRSLDDGKELYEYATISRGSDLIKRPYLALLANMTPADLKPYAKKGAALWGDGFLARFALVTPPDGMISDYEFPEGERTVPAELITPLRRWHERLGVPEVTINLEAEDEADKIVIQPPKITMLNLPSEVHKANYRYSKNLQTIMTNNYNTDLDANYSRFPEKALRMAMLFASISGSDTITLAHWAKAQTIAERWRSGLHELYNQLNAYTPSDQAENEERIIRTISKKQPVTIREIGRVHNMSSGEVQAIIRPLIDSGAVIEKREGRTSKYVLG